ncbi:MAG: YraN family protein [Desulfobulbaceae bacterium]|nr:YraN family protein [Desulfobulbaceae bacterium]
MTFKRQSLGKKGEEIARSYLEKQGYTIIISNFRTKSGEIDLIAKDGEVLVFVEVKTRTSEQFGSPFDAVTSRKRGQISRVAMEYMVNNGGMDQPARFDVVAVRMTENKPFVEIVKNAFELSW